MKALWQIILAILWRLRPVQALEVNLRDVIDIGLAMFADDVALDDITHDPAYRSTLAAAFFDAHRKLDLLIYMRACEIAGVRAKITSFAPDFSHTHKSTDLIALWRSFQRLVARFDDYERYAAKRAERLRAEENGYPLRLAATLQSTSPALCAVEANSPFQLNARFASISAQHWGRWIGASSRRDGGGGAFARGWLNATGPPSLPIFQKTQNREPAVTCGNAVARALHAQRCNDRTAVLFKHDNHTAAVRQFFDTVIVRNTTVRDDFTKSVLGLAPCLEARSPICMGHNQSPVHFRVRARKMPRHSAHQQGPHPANDGTLHGWNE